MAMVDTSTRNFIHFYPGYPSAAYASYGNCHAMASGGNSHDGKWHNSIDCGNSRFHYVCKKQATGYTNYTTAIEVTECEEHVVKGGIC